MEENISLRNYVHSQKKGRKKETPHKSIGNTPLQKKSKRGGGGSEKAKLSYKTKDFGAEPAGAVTEKGPQKLKHQNDSLPEWVGISRKKKG